MHAKQAAALRICYKQTYLSQKSKKIGCKNFSSKKEEIVTLIIFISDVIFRVIRILNDFVHQKTVPTIFEKKAFAAITYVTLKIQLESRKWQPLPAPGAPGLRCFCQPTNSSEARG